MAGARTAPLLLLVVLIEEAAWLAVDPVDAAAAIAASAAANAAVGTVTAQPVAVAAGVHVAAGK